MIVLLVLIYNDLVWSKCNCWVNQRHECYFKNTRRHGLTCYAEIFSHVSDCSDSTVDTSLLEVFVKHNMWMCLSLSRWLNLHKNVEHHFSLIMSYYYLSFINVQNGLGTNAFIYPCGKCSNIQPCKNNFNSSYNLTVGTNSRLIFSICLKVQGPWK